MFTSQTGSKVSQRQIPIVMDGQLYRGKAFDWVIALWAHSYLDCLMSERSMGALQRLFNKGLTLVCTLQPWCGCKFAGFSLQEHQIEILVTCCKILAEHKPWMDAPWGPG